MKDGKVPKVKKKKKRNEGTKTCVWTSFQPLISATLEIETRKARER